jgi:hypothetical protein
MSRVAHEKPERGNDKRMSSSITIALSGAAGDGSVTAQLAQQLGRWYKGPDAEVAWGKAKMQSGFMERF